MDADTSFNLLVEVITAILNEEIAPDLLTDDFIRSSKELLYIRRIVVAYRWHSFFETCYKKMFSSHRMYLTFIMFACINEHKYHQNIFDGFIDVFSLVLYLVADTNLKTRVKYCSLIPDIIKVFYLIHLKFEFCELRGLHRLVDYICSHRLLGRKRNKNNLSSEWSALDINATEIDFHKILYEEFKCGRHVKKVFRPDEIEHHAQSCFLAKTVVLLASVELPILPSYADLITRMVEMRKKKAMEMAGDKEKTEAAGNLEASNAALRGCSNSISDSKNNYDSEDQPIIERFENMIQAIIRHNHSKSAGNKNAKGRIQEKVDGVLEPLKHNIKSLIEALDI